ncbi:MAG TPA: flagellar biosynthesis protein FlhF [Polyangiaceae bacterium]|nr:flagellar biosynthesis protein FlhF [Polyangiaceae bacterium]
MEYQTFRGSDVHEALTAVRDALGSDALIGSTRRVSNGRAGAFGHTYIEIMAAPGRGGVASPSRDIAEQPAGRTPRTARERFAPRAPQPRAGQENLEQEIAQLKALVDELSHGRSPREKAQAMLNGAGIEGTLAKDLAQGSTRAARAGRGALRTWLRNRLADRIMVQPRLVERNYPQLIACVGPTGVGKTTTLAKLAARAAIDLGRSVHVISLDTFRVGAVEQWKRYAELIGIPFDVARDANEFAEIMARSDADLFLVDTAGRTAEDDTPTRRLVECLERATDIRQEILLVLPAWLRAADAERLAAGYSEPKPTALVVTKLDETNEIGGVLHAALPGSTPVAYLCNGPRVPEDIRDAAVGTVVDAVLPREE